MTADPARLLLRTLRRSAIDAGCAIDLEHEAEIPWASATFVGAQHRVVVTGEAVGAWLAALPDADLSVRQHFVASVDVAATTTGALLTVLVLEA